MLTAVENMHAHVQPQACNRSQVQLQLQLTYVFACIPGCIHMAKSLQCSIMHHMSDQQEVIILPFHHQRSRANQTTGKVSHALLLNFEDVALARIAVRISKTLGLNVARKVTSVEWAIFPRWLLPHHFCNGHIKLTMNGTLEGSKGLSPSLTINGPIHAPGNLF